MPGHRIVDATGVVIGASSTVSTSSITASRRTMLDLGAETNCDCKELETQRGSIDADASPRKTLMRSNDHHTQRSSVECVSRHFDADRGSRGPCRPVFGQHVESSEPGGVVGTNGTVKQCGCRVLRSAVGSPRVSIDTPREVHLWQ